MLTAVSGQGQRGRAGGGREPPVVPLPRRGPALGSSGEGPVRAGVSFGRPAGGSRERRGVLGGARGFFGNAQESPWGCPGVSALSAPREWD